MSLGLFNVVFFISWCLLGVVLVKIIFFISLSSRHHARHKRRHPKELREHPFVSVLVPSYNEGLTLRNCITSLMAQTYQRLEIVIVDDGSTDNTYAVAQELAAEHERIRVIHKENGGKASALNAGVAEARGAIVVSIDADSIFLPNTVEQLVLSFQDPAVAAVGGNVKVANRDGVLARQQALEYITGLTLQRRAFSHLGCMQVISGAIGAFRRDVLLAIGGYSSDTIVEDMDITIELASRGHKVVYNPSAIAYTEAPESLHDFFKQRYRWTYGGFQVLSKHRRHLWRRQNNYLGYVGMPYFLIFPWVEVFISLVFFVTVGHAITSGHFSALLLMSGVMCAVQTVLVGYALVIDDEDKKLSFLTIIDSFFYYHLVGLTTLRAGLNFLRKKQVHWNKLQRYGKNLLPVALPTLAVEPVRIKESPVLRRPQE